MLQNNGAATRSRVKTSRLRPLVQAPAHMQRAVRLTVQHVFGGKCWRGFWFRNAANTLFRFTPCFHVRARLQVGIMQPDCVQRWGVKLDWAEKATSATGGSYFVIEPLQIEMCGHLGFAAASLGLFPGVSILFSTRDDAPLQQEAKAGGA